MTTHANALSCQWGVPFSPPVLLIQPHFISSNNQRTLFWHTFFDSLKTRSYFKQAALTLGLMAIPVSQTTFNTHSIYANTALSDIWNNSIDLIPNYVQPLSLNTFENKSNTVLTRFNTAISVPIIVNSVTDRKSIHQKDSIQKLQELKDLKLSKENLRLAQFFAKKYYVSSLDIEKYIHYAEQVAQIRQLESSLILAVMSIESNMNPFAQSSMGAQGLMQVMTSVHSDKYALLGGVQRAFDPKANITVGGMILAKYIKMGGSVKSGLKYYVGATGPSDGGYAAKVLAEKSRIEKARLGTFDFTANKLPLNYSTVSANSTVNTALTKKNILPNNINYLATSTINPLNRSITPAAALSVVSLSMPSSINIINTNTDINTNVNTSNTNKIIDMNLQSPTTQVHQDHNSIASTAIVDTVSGTTHD